MFIYVFYRTEKTLINEILIWHISYDHLFELQERIACSIPLNKHIIYSLPEGLWVFCITLTSQPFFLKIGRREFDLLYLPLIFSIGLELFQLFHFTNGRFDFWDIGASVLFWSIAYFLSGKNITKQNILNPFTIHSFICVMTYLIVYLAHSWR